MIQPWVDATPGSHASEQVEGHGDAPPLDPIAAVVARLLAVLGETMLLGVRNCSLTQWREVLRDVEAIGLVRLARPIVRLTHMFEERDSSLAWDGRDACSRLFDVAVMADIARETAS